jgi:hypothetical protein
MKQPTKKRDQGATKAKLLKAALDVFSKGTTLPQPARLPKKQVLTNR